MRRGAFSLALLVGVVNAACVNFRPPPLALSAEASGGAPAQVWSVTAGRRFTGPVALDDRTLYGAGVDRRVYAMDLSNGAVRWSSRLSGIIGGGLLVSGDTIFAATSRPQGRVFALDRLTGKQIWRANTGLVGAPLSMCQRLVLVPTQRGELLALEPATGTIRWRRKVGVARVAAVEIDSASALVATVDSLLTVNLTDGKVLRRIRSPGTVISPWVGFQNRLVAGTTDSLVVMVRPDTVGVVWRVRLDAPVLGSPGAIGDTLYAASRRGTLYRIVADSSPRAEPIVALDWPITAPVTIVDGEILLGGADGTIRALTPQGAERWRLQLWPSIDVGPIALSDGLLAIGGEGDVHRYRR